MCSTYDQTESHYTAGPIGAKGNDEHKIQVPTGCEVADVELIVVEQYSGGCRLVAPPPQGATGSQTVVVHWWYNAFGKIRYRLVVRTRLAPQYLPPRAAITLTSFSWLQGVEPDQPEEPYLMAIPFLVDARTSSSGKYSLQTVGHHGNIGYLWQVGETRPIPTPIGLLRTDAEPLDGRVLFGVLLGVADEDFTPSVLVQAHLESARSEAEGALRRIVAARKAAGVPLAGPLNEDEQADLQHIASTLLRAVSNAGQSWNPDDPVGSAIRVWSIDTSKPLHVVDQVRMSGAAGQCIVDLALNSVAQGSPEGLLELFEQSDFGGERRTAPLALYDPSRLQPWRFGSEEAVPRSLRWRLHPCSEVEIHAQLGASDPVLCLRDAGANPNVPTVGPNAPIAWRWRDGYVAITAQQQERSRWCWAAVTSSLSRYYQPLAAVSQCELATRVFAGHGWDCCSDTSVGNRTLDITRALDEIGLHHEFHNDDVGAEAIRDWLRSNRALIAVIRWPSNDQHFVLIHGIDHRDRVWLSDSAGGTTSVLPIEEAKVYHGGDWFLTLVVSCGERTPHVPSGPRILPVAANSLWVHPHRMDFIAHLDGAAPRRTEWWRAFPRDGAPDQAAIGTRDAAGRFIPRWSVTGPRVAAARQAFEDARVPSGARGLSACVDDAEVLTWDAEDGDRLAWVLSPSRPALPQTAAQSLSMVATRARG